jgi:hypothetical protein
MRHKIEILKLNHNKITKESKLDFLIVIVKDQWASRESKDGEHDDLKQKILIDLEKVE